MGAVVLDGGNSEKKRGPAMTSKPTSLPHRDGFGTRIAEVMFVTFVLAAVGASPARAASLTGVVTAPTMFSANPPILVTITSQQMVPLFVEALRTPNTTVIVNTDLDLSGLPNSFGESRILITDGVTLIGGRTAVPGQPFRAGPLLFVTDHPNNLFEVQGDLTHARSESFETFWTILRGSNRVAKSRSKRRVSL
jgi:hypothetical protein